MSDPREWTLLLRRVQAGDEGARAELLPQVYALLRAIAAGAVERYDARSTLQPTALVHEAYLRLFGGPTATFADREHFLSVAASAMRNILVDHARARSASKRGGRSTHEPLDELLVSFEEHAVDLIDLHAALERLAEFAPLAASAVELRFFGGLTSEEAARVLGSSTRTLEREWRTARAWLYRALAGDDEREALGS
jgi:RNA polymerase sigma factor (TIGR02999 family)